MHIVRTLHQHSIPGLRQSRQRCAASRLGNGARDASYQTVMRGIDLIKDAGIGKVSLVSLPEEQS